MSKHLHKNQQAQAWWGLPARLEQLLERLVVYELPLRLVVWSLTGALVRYQAPHRKNQRPRSEHLPGTRRIAVERRHIMLRRCKQWLADYCKL